MSDWAIALQTELADTCLSLVGGLLLPPFPMERRRNLLDAWRSDLVDDGDKDLHGREGLVAVGSNLTVQLRGAWAGYLFADNPRDFGRTNLRSSRLGFGSLTLGLLYHELIQQTIVPAQAPEPLFVGWSLIHEGVNYFGYGDLVSSVTLPLLLASIVLVFVTQGFNRGHGWARMLCPLGACLGALAALPLYLAVVMCCLTIILWMVLVLLIFVTGCVLLVVAAYVVYQAATTPTNPSVRTPTTSVKANASVVGSSVTGKRRRSLVQAV